MEHELDPTNISDIESCKGAVRKISKLLKILLIRGKSACKEFFRVMEVDLKREDLIQKMKYKSAEIKRRGNNCIIHVYRYIFSRISGYFLDYPIFTFSILYTCTFTFLFTLLSRFVCYKNPLQLILRK